MSLLRGWRKQNRDALTFHSKRGVSSFVAQTAAEAKAAAGAWTPNRVFRIAYKLACWAIRRAKKYTDTQIAAGVSAESPARFHVKTDGFQVIDANEDAGLFMSDLVYQSPASLLDNPDWLSWGEGAAAEAILSEGLWHQTFFIRMKFLVSAASKVRVRLRMRVYRSSSGIADDLLGEEVMWWDSSYIWVTDYGGSWGYITASIDYEALDGDTFVPSLVAEGLPSGGEIEVHGYWCAHRVGSL